MMRCSLLAVIWLCCAVSQANALTYYIESNGGDDARDGLKPETSWQTLDRVNRAELSPGDRVLFRRGQVWRGQLLPKSGTSGAVITYGAYGAGPKPVLLGSVDVSKAEHWERVEDGLWATRFAGKSSSGAGKTNASPLSVDVGNIIFDEGKSVGFKKWSVGELRREGDYYYDPGLRQVSLRSKENPAKVHSRIELALRKHIIDQGGRSYVTYENLDLRYGAAHGIGGGGTHHITIRSCDLSFIGGGHQFTPADGKPVRFGNAIEFWSGARDSLVEECRIWEVYDAALTNQGDGTNVQENITYRGNIISNCEYSFEYWNRGEASQTRHIVFENNTCLDAGYGWGHTQRPDPNGRHLMFYDNSAVTTNVVVRSNVFSRATDSLLRLHGRDWTAALKMDYNRWYQPAGAWVLWGREAVEESHFLSFMRARHFDLHSTAGAPTLPVRNRSGE